jgi:hypothetical protein
MDKSAATKQLRETTFVPVVSMEEVPVLSEGERAELVASLKEGQAAIAAGAFTELAGHGVGPWLARIAGEERRKKADGAKSGSRLIGIAPGSLA